MISFSFLSIALGLSDDQCPNACAQELHIDLIGISTLLNEFYRDFTGKYIRLGKLVILD